MAFVLFVSLKSAPVISTGTTLAFSPEAGETDVTVGGGGL